MPGRCRRRLKHSHLLALHTNGATHCHLGRLCMTVCVWPVGDPGSNVKGSLTGEGRAVTVQVIILSAVVP